MNQNRQQQLQQWLKSKTLGEFDLVLLQGDASLRKFYRLDTKPSTILMDVQADLKNQEFLQAAQILTSHGLRIPEILAHDLSLGAFLVEDFGDILLHNLANQSQSIYFLEQAITSISKIQAIPTKQITNPTKFDTAFIERELNLFFEWFLEQYIEIQLTYDQQAILRDTFQLIGETLFAKPYVCMHRDFHSKNIMILPDNSLGIIDFQDLMLGPITYDLVSLLKDCYWTWPDTLIEKLLIDFYQTINSQGIFNNFDEFKFYFDITGLQRHLKVLGGFSKIYFSRNNGTYLQYFDRIFNYVIQVTGKYSQFNSFHHLLVFNIFPKLFS